MLAGKTPAQLRKLKALGLDKPLEWDLGNGPPRRDDDEDDFNPADLVVDVHTAIDEIEPLAVREDDVARIANEWSKSMLWLSQAKSLVEMGWRLHAMLQVFRPALLEGMAFEVRVEYERDLRRSMALPLRSLRVIGEFYRDVLAWCRRCNSLSQLGQRGFAMIYVKRRDLIPDLSTNAALGGLAGKTRQAFNKTVGDFRDSHRGFRNAVMRDETTRIKCQTAQQNLRR